MRRSLARTVGVFVATIMLCLGALPTYADEPEIDCSVPGNCYTTRGLRTDDVIRYDNFGKVEYIFPFRFLIFLLVST